MAEITASMVKELRDKTGAGMMDCKNALKESGGDVEAAVDWLRKKGLSKAAGKADRVAAQGLVGLTAAGRHGAVVEVNSETDFVARNATFQEMVATIAALAPKAEGDVSKLLALPFDSGKETVEEHVKEAVATIGENMTVRRTAYVSVKEGVVADYVHGKVADNLGKIATLVALESAGDEPSLFEIGRQIAMHVAATAPIAIDLDGVPEETLEREKAILRDKNAGKPDHVMEKIIASGMKSYAKENTLLEQAYIHDSSKTVAQALKEAEKVAGSAIKIAAIVRYALGEGIEKKEEDFAAEVARTAAAASGA